MWAYIVRRLLYNIPVYLGIILLLMVALRVQDPAYAYLGKHAQPGDVEEWRARVGLDQPFVVQYVSFLVDILTLDFTVDSWGKPGHTVSELLANAVWPSVAITLPALIITTILSISVGLVSASRRGGWVDRMLVVGAVLGMSVSYLVYVILGQYFGAFWLNEKLGFDLFAISGFEPELAKWPRYCLLPVMISVIVAMGYDTRYYRAVMVEECSRDYITTARAKGATRSKVLFVHMLKNAMIPIITRVMITLPFLITGSILLENFFNIPGMGRTLLKAIIDKDFPVIQTFTAMFAAFFIATNLLTDVLYAMVDPRVRLR